MSDWDDDEATSAPAAAAAAPPAIASLAAGRRRFEDEDAEDEIKDDWEASDEEPEKPLSAPVPLKKKGTVKQKIAEKEAEEKRRRELGLDSDEEEEEEEEDPNERRRREKEAQIKADVENAANLLGTSKISADDPLSKLRSTNPSSKEDWESFSTSLFNEILKKQSTRPGFDKHFAPHFIKLLSEPLRDVDMRKLSVKLKELAEDKVRKEKEAKKSGGGNSKSVTKPKPKSVGTSSAKNTIDTSAYGDEALDDDLDFM